jgi:hypothetical protein
MPPSDDPSASMAVTRRDEQMRPYAVAYRRSAAKLEMLITAALEATLGLSATEQAATWLESPHRILDSTRPGCRVSAGEAADLVRKLLLRRTGPAELRNFCIKHPGSHVPSPEAIAALCDRATQLVGQLASAGMHLRERRTQVLCRKLASTLPHELQDEVFRHLDMFPDDRSFTPSNIHAAIRFCGAAPPTLDNRHFGALHPVQPHSQVQSWPTDERRLLGDDVYTRALQAQLRCTVFTVRDKVLPVLLNTDLFCAGFDNAAHLRNVVAVSKLDAINALDDLAPVRVAAQRAGRAFACLRIKAGFAVQVCVSFKYDLPDKDKAHMSQNVFSAYLCELRRSLGCEADHIPIHFAVLHTWEQKPRLSPNPSVQCLTVAKWTQQLALAHGTPGRNDADGAADPHSRGHEAPSDVVLKSASCSSYVMEMEVEEDGEEDEEHLSDVEV